MARLIIFQDQASSTIFEAFSLEENRIIIGSDQDNQLVLDIPHIDPMHASLELRDNHWFLQDLGGPGGTSINGQLIEGPQMLHHNDIIELGPVRLQFQIDDERGVTQQFSTQLDEPEETAVESGGSAHISGRVWFAGLAAATITIIFVILMLIVATHLLGLINIQNLLPALFGGT